MDTDSRMSIKRKHEDTDSSITATTDDKRERTIHKKSKTKKNVRFDDVTVYYFARSQGFVSVPSQGTITLGMASEHSHVEQYSVADFSRLRRALHKSILRERKLLPPSSAVDSDDDGDDDDEALPVDDYYFVQPIATRQRRSLLKQAGLAKLDATEKHDLNIIRRSREVCGCSCTRETGGCQPSTCDCYLNGIACQVDRLTFPCPCATMLCKNPLGRLEFNQNRVRNHFCQTMTRLEAEKRDEESTTGEKHAVNQSSTIGSLLSFMLSTVEAEDENISSLLHSLVDQAATSAQEEPSPMTSSTTADLSPSSSASTHDHSVRRQRLCHPNSSSLAMIAAQSS